MSVANRPGTPPYATPAYAVSASSTLCPVLLAQIMAVAPAEVYVTANLKETQLTRVRRNQPAKIKVDAYPELMLRGHVDGIQPSSGQAFSILPPQNATGNWVKIVQRVPVKIVFDGPAGDSDHRLGPGMSVEVKINVNASGN